MSLERLLLSRHGETPNNLERRFTGWDDPSLTVSGRRQARALGRRLRETPIDTAYSSDLRRTVETAKLALAGRDGVPIQQTPALREANFGAWQGLTFDEAQAQYPGQFSRLLRRSVDFRPPGGETILEVQARVMTFFSRINSLHRDQTVLVVASGGPLQILIASLLGMPVAGHWRLGMRNCNVSIVSFADGEPLLLTLNDISHLLQPRRTRRSPTIQS